MNAEQPVLIITILLASIAIAGWIVGILYKKYKKSMELKKARESYKRESQEVQNEL